MLPQCWRCLALGWVGVGGNGTLSGPFPASVSPDSAIAGVRIRAPGRKATVPLCFLPAGTELGATVVLAASLDAADQDEKQQSMLALQHKLVAVSRCAACVWLQLGCARKRWGHAVMRGAHLLPWCPPLASSARTTGNRPCSGHRLPGEPERAAWPPETRPRRRTPREVGKHSSDAR